MTSPAVALRRSLNGQVAVVSLSGEHDLSTAADLRRVFLNTHEAQLVVLDFHEATFIDSTILGVIVAAAKRTAKGGHELIAVNATGIVRKALELTGLAALLRLTSDVELDLEEAAALIVSSGAGS